MPELIYRVEDKERMGPYHSTIPKSQDWQDRERDFDRDTPCPNDEAWNSRTAEEISRKMYIMPYKHGFEHVKFGFKSLEHLKHWFSKDELMRLKEMSFIVVYFIVRDAFHSRTQTMYIEENQEREIIKWEKVL